MNDLCRFFGFFGLVSTFFSPFQAQDFWVATSYCRENPQGHLVKNSKALRRLVLGLCIPLSGAQIFTEEDMGMEGD